MFRKETVEDMDEQSETTPNPPTPIEVDTTEIPDTISSENDSALANTREPGFISVDLPKGLNALDSLYKKEPPQVNGYRIQIYFGNLTEARELRSSFISSNKDVPCYLVQNPPNFAIHVGDFRRELDAYRLIQELKAAYPSAIIVPSAIQNP